MAAAFDTFRFPAQFSEFIPYSGPKRMEPSTDAWREIEMLLETVPAELEAPRVGVAVGPDHPLEGNPLRKYIRFTLAQPSNSHY